MPHCRVSLQPGLQRALADRRRTARAEVALYADITRLCKSERWKEPDFLDKLKDTYLTRKEIETADLHTWQDVLQWRGDLERDDPAIYQGTLFATVVRTLDGREHMPSDAGVREVAVDVRVPDWSYLFRADHKVFVYPMDYAKPVVVTTWANLVECVKNAAGPNVFDVESGEHSFYDLSYELAIGEADISCITREKLDEYGKETEEYHDDFCVWLEAAALAEYGRGFVNVSDRAPDSAFDPAVLQTLVGEHARSQQYVYRASS